MRFFTLPIAIAAVTFAGSPSVERASPRPLVVVVHGRGLLGQDTAALRRDWKRALDAALGAAGFVALRDEDVRVAWYADVLDAESDSGCAVSAGDTRESLGLGAFVRGIFASLAFELPAEERLGARGLIGDLLYFVDPWKRCAAQRRVGSIIDSDRDRPIIVMAYSLGSLVTYGHLSNAARDPKRVVHLITVGSPLGIREVRDFVLENPKLATPSAVARWVNIYDPDDGFAAPIAPSGDTTRAHDFVTQTRSEGDPHAIERYLRDRATGTALARSLCLTAKKHFDQSCRRLPADVARTTGP